MFKETGVNDVYSKVVAALSDRKMQYIDSIATDEFSEEDSKNMKYFYKIVNVTKKGEKTFGMLANNLYRLAKKNNAKAITNYIKEVKINEDRSMFYVGMVI